MLLLFHIYIEEIEQNLAQDFSFLPLLTTTLCLGGLGSKQVIELHR